MSMVCSVPIEKATDEIKEDIHAVQYMYGHGKGTVPALKAIRDKLDALIAGIENGTIENWS